MPEIKDLFQEAGEALAKARAIVDEYDESDMPDEKLAEYSLHMEEYDEKSGQAEGMNEQRKRTTRIESAESFMGEAQNRLPAPTNGKSEDPHGQSPEVKAAVNSYLRGGMRGLNADESKALQADDDEAGGFLVMPMVFAGPFLQAVDDAVHMRQLATVFPLDTAMSLGVPTLADDIGDPTWTAEILTGAEDSDMDVGDRQLTPHPLARRIKIANKLLRQSTIDVSALVTQRLSFKIGTVSENAYLNGTGANQPLGIFVDDDSGISDSRDVTAAGDASPTNTIHGDDLIETKHTLKSQYWASARWFMHRTILKEVRLLKDSTGQYIWQPGLAADLPSAILDVPYVISEFAPSDSSSGLYVAAIGDFSFYWIADALDMQIQVLNELYAETNQIGYIARLETDGMPVLEEAFNRLVMA